MRRLLNIIGSAVIGLASITDGYAQEGATAKTSDTKIIAEYPEYFAEDIDGVHYYLAK